MPDLRPFSGLRYAPADPVRISALLCPPYDVISHSERERLASSDAHNAVHLELPEPDPDTPGGDAYAHAARLLDEWLAAGVLQRDERPLLYVYEQRFPESGGGEQVARSFFCRLRLEPYGVGVRAHERTLSGPKEDRLRLLSATRTNLSPVLLLYDDDAGGSVSARLLDELISGQPVVDAIGPGGVHQRLWTADPARQPATDALLRLAAQAPLSIADGHHRYETALRYRDVPGAAPGSGYVMGLLYDAHSGGLNLLPWHRLISRVPDVPAVMRAACELFTVEPTTSVDELARRLEDGQGSGLIGLWTRDGGALLCVDRDRIGPLLDPSGSDAIRWLDVSVLSATLRAMTGSSTDQLLADARMSYVSDAGQAIAAVISGSADVCFLLQPTPVESVLAVAANGEHMPAKSTYFHPKAATGLVFNPIDR